jgi:O-antigen ligase
MGEKPRFTPVSLVFIVFLGMMTLSYLGSEWRRYVYGDFENMVKVLLIFWVAQSLLVTRERVRFFVFFYLGVFGLWPVRGGIFNVFVYHSFTQGRVAWNQAFANPNDLGALLLFPLGLAASALVVESKKQVRLAAIAGCILIPLVVAFTQSRGAILGVLAAGAYLFVRNKKARVGMLVGGSVLGIVLAIFAPNSLWDRLGSFNEAVTSGDLKAADDHGSADQRLAIWKVSSVVIAQHPIIGVGPGAYPFAHLLAARSPDEAATAHGLRDTHSTYLNVMAEYGIPAFFVFMTAAFLVWSKSTRAR